MLRKMVVQTTEQVQVLLHLKQLIHQSQAEITGLILIQQFLQIQIHNNMLVLFQIQRLMMVG